MGGFFAVWTLRSYKRRFIFFFPRVSRCPRTPTCYNKCLFLSLVQAAPSWLVYLFSPWELRKNSVDASFDITSIICIPDTFPWRQQQQTHTLLHRLPEHKLSKQQENPICLWDLIFEVLCLRWNSQAAWFNASCCLNVDCWLAKCKTSAETSVFMTLAASVHITDVMFGGCANMLRGTLCDFSEFSWLKNTLMFMKRHISEIKKD